MAALPSRRLLAVCVLVCVVGALSCGDGGMSDGQCPARNMRRPRQASAPIYSYTVLAKHPHDPEAFTQGLVYDNGRFLEGTGLWGRSEVRHVDIASGDTTHSVAMDDTYFGEGITVWDGKIVQITWKSRQGFVYDKETLELERTWTYANSEGWGLTHDATSLIMSDGSSMLYFLNPVTFERERAVQVTLNGVALMRLNELEFINGEVWANVWFNNNIFRIDPETGVVLSVVNMAGILSAEDRNGAQVDVLNGIAHDPATNRIWVTGKLWPMLYEIQVDDPELAEPTVPDPSPVSSPLPPSHASAVHPVRFLHIMLVAFFVVLLI